MAPRRSVGRTATATPARTTRATSAVAVENSGGRRATRASSQQPGVSDDVVNNPQLPELQTQQSYAYGSTKSPTLPEQLGSRDPMSLRQVADNIDDQADKHFENHVTQAQKNLDSSPPAARTRRTASREPGPAASEKPKPASTEKEARIAAWADSLDESHLKDIPEEDSDHSEVPDDATRKDTDPSSFPSVILDNSYNYERGLRKPRQANIQYERGSTVMQHMWEPLKSASVSFAERMGELWLALTKWMARIANATAAAVKGVPDSPVFAGAISLLVATILVGAAGFLFCSIYSRVLCNPDSSSAVAVNLQKLCGSCHVASAAYDFSHADSQDLTKISRALASLNRQMQEIERRLGQRVDTNHAALELEMDLLKQQHNDLSNLLHNTQYQQGPVSTEGIASPLIPRINFFAPSNGALVVPSRSSPTRAKQKPFPIRFVLKVSGTTKYQANPPVTALEPWQDVGDCWCGPDVAPGQDIIRLMVTTRELIYPTELVVEHLPTAGSLRPDTAPKKMELWADFSHLDHEDWDKLRLYEMQEGNVLDTWHARLGEMEYDASGRTSHVQAFRLDVNQHGLFHYAKDFTLRVTSNYGADFSCLYRVRLHGKPVVGPAEIQADSGWYESHGYDTESE